MFGGMYLVRRVRLQTLVFVQIVAGALFVLSPAMPSADPYAYFRFGEMLAYGEDS